MPLPRSVNRAGPEQSAQPEGGANEVVFAYCISCVALTWQLWSRPYRIPSRRWARIRGLPYSLVSVTLGWWGAPWGFLLTPATVWTNWKGGVPADRTGRAAPEGGRR
jgi:hypothetical protein